MRVRLNMKGSVMWLHAANIKACVEAEYDGREFSLIGTDTYRNETNRLMIAVMMYQPRLDRRGMPIGPRAKRVY